jgi:hypothetical protein
MFEQETKETTRFKKRQLCDAERIDRDKFCRRCGDSQSRRIDSLKSPSGSVSSEVIGRADSSGCETRPLSSCGTLRRSYSGRLVGIVAQELSEQTSSLRANRWAMLLISLLVAAPLWLMIILLSPLDAYAVAKDLANQV